MPEFIRDPQVLTGIETFGLGPTLPDEAGVQTWTKRMGKEVLGHGFYSTVIALDDNRCFAVDRVASYFMYPFESQKDFYYQRILHSLYPKHFPKIFAAYSFLLNQDGKVCFGGTLRERIHTDQEKQAKLESEMSFDPHLDPNGFPVIINGWQVKKYVPKRMLRIMLEWRENGVPLAFDHTKGAEHFRVGEDGNIKYLDLPAKQLAEENSWDIDKIRNFMVSKRFSDEEIKTTLSLAKRVIHLENVEYSIGRIAHLLYRKNNQEIEEILSAGKLDQWVDNSFCDYPPDLVVKPDKTDIPHIKMQIRINRYYDKLRGFKLLQVRLS